MFMIIMQFVVGALFGYALANLLRILNEEK